ncbi:MAG: CarD family transcriptional regulator [Pseudorhodoplanes sp.]
MIFHAKAVADKTRRSKKASASDSRRKKVSSGSERRAKASTLDRRTSQAARRSLSVAKAPVSKSSASKPSSGSKTPASKTSVSKAPAAKASPAKVAPKVSAVKPVAAKAPAPKSAVTKAAPVAKVPVNKPTTRPKTDGEGANSGMTSKKTTQRQGFKTNEFIVYPAHGVGQILAIEEQEIAGAKLELFVINFIKDKMTLRVPTSKIASVGMRKLAEPATVKKALETLKGRARIKRTMWSRRAQEYEAKINSGDIVAISEVVRDLYRSEMQPEQSYSERQLYEAALDRLSREISAVQHVTETEAVKEIEAALAKGPRRGPAKAAAETEAEDAAVEEEAA